MENGVRMSSKISVKIHFFQMPLDTSLRLKMYSRNDRSLISAGHLYTSKTPDLKPYQHFMKRPGKVSFVILHIS